MSHGTFGKKDFLNYSERGLCYGLGLSFRRPCG